ncbi:glycosyltransferase [Nonlabens ponticola]|uniref:Glycosyltransferase n=2 Tax=Nonlabens ponticola TaxID=2496866 RepID=A0A3S9N1F0_9FLAO|nr:glycosyltransferase [Nonlabens ponticola]
MRIAIIIPAHNEEAFIAQTLQSLVDQTLKPSKVIVVSDNSTDDTAAIAGSFQDKLPLQVIEDSSSAQNVPGSKVINAFNKGLEIIDPEKYDLICKYDADLIFPSNYLEIVVSRFRESKITGMAAGHCTILKNGQWVVENQNNPDHIRGALKAYHVDCFKQIGGLRATIGWDTIDEMLARFYGWQVVTIDNLYVKHLKPTGAAYHKKSKFLQGEAFYKMRYGYLLTAITAIKMAAKHKNATIFYHYLKGYQLAQRKNLEPIVTPDQGRFIRKYRWNGIKKKLGF